MGLLALERLRIDLLYKVELFLVQDNLGAGCSWLVCTFVSSLCIAAALGLFSSLSCLFLLCRVLALVSSLDHDLIQCKDVVLELLGCKVKQN